MEFLRAIEETEVAETFLRAELQSPRFRDEIRAGRRGWRIGGLFDGFPTTSNGSVSPSGRARCSTSTTSTGTGGSGSRTERVLLSSQRDGSEQGSSRARPLNPDSERIARRLESDDPPPELIAVATPTGPMVLVEGHVRLTAYALFPEYLPRQLEILLGISERVSEWSEY